MPYPSAAQTGRGAQLYAGDGATPTEGWDLTAEMLDISNADPRVREMIDCTSQETPDGSEEKRPGMLKNGDFVFDCNYIPTHATHDGTTGLRADMVSGVLRHFRYVFPARNKRLAFSAFVSSFAIKNPVTDLLRATVTLTITGVVTEEAHP